MFDYYEDEEHELFQYDDDSDNDEEELNPEDWQDSNSEELLNIWMTIVEYHEMWYIHIRRTFNDLCQFVYSTQYSFDEVITIEVQAMKNHQFVKGRNWEYFFSKSFINE